MSNSVANMLNVDVIAGMDTRQRETVVEWYETLRSGKYGQGTGSMRRVDENGKMCYCPLGVLAEIGAKKYPREFEHFPWGDSYMPSFSYYGLLGEFARVLHQGQLAEMNDWEGKTFENIANYIEEKYQKYL